MNDVEIDVETETTYRYRCLRCYQRSDPAADRVLVEADAARHVCRVVVPFTADTCYTVTPASKFGAIGRIEDVDGQIVPWDSVTAIDIDAGCAGPAIVHAVDIFTRRVHLLVDVAAYHPDPNTRGHRRTSLRPPRPIQED